MLIHSLTIEARDIARAGAVYFAIVFVVGFALGAVRTLLVAPRLGEPLAVVLELPLMLVASWIVCGRVVQRWDVPARAGPRLAMGAVAVAFLVAAEISLSLTVFDRSFADYLRTFTTAHGLLGLSGQIAFGLFPLFCRPR